MAKAKTPGKRPQANAEAPAWRQGAVRRQRRRHRGRFARAQKPRTSPAQFFSQVRAEGRKIVWPSRKETWITSVMVFIMVIIASIFFWIVDTGLGFAFRWIIGLGS